MAAHGGGGYILPPPVVRADNAYPWRCAEDDVLSRRSVLISMLLGTVVALPVSVTAANPITVQVITGLSCVNGTGPRNAEVIATLRTPSGAERGRARTTSDAFGTWATCFRLAEPTTFINGGDRLQINAGNRERTFRIPHLEPRVDRVRDVIQGWAAPNSSVDIVVSHRKTFRNVRDFFYQVNTDANGRYRVDTTSDFNLIGFDEIAVVNLAGRNLFGSVALAPGLQLAVANNVVFGSVNNGTRVHIRLYDGDGNAKAHSTAGPLFFGTFEVAMFKRDGSAAYPLNRDWVTSTIASDAVLRIPISELRGSATTDVITGRCPPDAPYLITAGTREFYGRADGDGGVRRDASSRMNLRRGTELSLYCMYPTGDIWQDVDIAL